MPERKDAQAHYDALTDAWTLLLGDNLHYGFFAEGDETLAQATDALIDTLAALASLDRDTVLLDVGSGTGNPACHLAERTGCRVSGLSLSAREVEIAREAARRRGVSDRVSFQQRDAMDSGFPADSFDVAWAMESSHLMPDKAQLCAEVHRVLRPGGTLLLCDQILKRGFSAEEIYRRVKDLALLDRCFGKAKMETLDFYEATLRAHGFVQIERRDISREVVPTLDRWQESLTTNRDALAASVGEEYLREFARACDILKVLFTEERFGYGIVKAVKSPRTGGQSLS